MSTHQRPVSHQYSPVLDEEPKKKGCGCFLIGCLGSTLLSIVVVVGATIYTKNLANDFILDYTEETPEMFADLGASEEEIESASRKISELNKAFDQEAAPQTIDLTARDLNVFFNSDHAVNPLRGLGIELRTEIGEKLSTSFSVPLEQAAQVFGGILAGEGRYLNGQATLRIFTEDGTPKVYLDDISLNSKDLPSKVKSSLSAGNIAERGKSNNEDVNTLLEKIDRLELVEGSLRVTTK